MHVIPAYWQKAFTNVASVMGSAKFPEEIEERRTEGLFSADAPTDPIIGDVLARETQSKVVPQKADPTSQRSLGSRNGLLPPSKKKVLRAHLKALLSRLEFMQGDPFFRDMPRAERLRAELVLRQQILQLRSRIGSRRG